MIDNGEDAGATSDDNASARRSSNRVQLSNIDDGAIIELQLMAFVQAIDLFALTVVRPAIVEVTDVKVVTVEARARLFRSQFGGRFLSSQNALTLLGVLLTIFFTLTDLVSKITSNSVNLDLVDAKSNPTLRTSGNEMFVTYLHDAGLAISVPFVKQSCVMGSMDTKNIGNKFFFSF